MAATISPSPGLGQHDAGGRFRDVGRGRHRDAHLRLAQGRRVVGAVAAHADGVAVPLERLDEPELVFGKDAGIDGEIVGARRCRGSVPAGRPPPPARSQRATVAAVAAASPVIITVRTPSDRSSASSARRVGARRIAQRDQPDHAQPVWRPGRDGEGAVAGSGQRLQPGRGAAASSARVRRLRPARP